MLFTSVGPAPCTPLRITRFNDTPTRTTPRAQSLHDTEKPTRHREVHTNKKKRKENTKIWGATWAVAEHSMGFKGRDQNKIPHLGGTSGTPRTCKGISSAYTQTDLVAHSPRAEYYQHAVFERLRSGSN